MYYVDCISLIIRRGGFKEAGVVAPLGLDFFLFFFILYGRKIFDPFKSLTLLQEKSPIRP